MRFFAGVVRYKLRSVEPSMLLGLIGVAIFLISLVLSTGIAVAFLVQLPADYFTRNRESRGRERFGAVQWLRFFGKNLVALVVIAVGIVLSVPGIPGQGVLTILLGIMLADFPGKQKLERKLIGMPSVLSAVNRLRKRFKKPPLVIDLPPGPHYQGGRA
jgi:hypothetical protein